MATPTDIANLALSYLGDALITAADLTTPSTVHAQLIVNVFNHTLDEVLADHDWDFSTVWSTELTALVGVSSPDFDFYFDLPDGTTPALTPNPFCLLVRQTDKDTAREPWGVEGRRIGLSFSNTVKLKYRSRVTDTTLWSPAAVTALSYCIASKIAYPITESQSVADQMMQLYTRYAMPKARSNNAMERPAQTVRSSTLTSVRLE